MSVESVQKSGLRCSIGRVLAAVLLLGLGVFGQPGAAAAAAVITVTTTADDLLSNGNCSLREAIQAANTDKAVDACQAGSGTDSISLPAGTYTLSLAGANEDANLMGDLDLSSSMTITGAGDWATIIDSHQLDRVFHILSGAVVTLEGLTITGGHAPDGAGLNQTDGLPGQSGGGIYNSGNLTLHYVTVTANQAGHGDHGAAGVLCSASFRFCTANGGQGGNGGGIYNDQIVTLEHVTLNSNQSGAGGAGGSINCSGANNNCYSDGGGSGNGAGLFSNKNSASLFVIASRLDGNVTGVSGADGTISACGTDSDCSTSPGSEGDGGGIYLIQGYLNLVDTTVSNNSSRDLAGGVQCQDSFCDFERSLFYGNSAGMLGGGLVVSGGSDTLINSTFNGNSSKGSGGGLVVSGGTVTLNFVTLANNTADSNHNGLGNGGGIYVGGGTVNLKNSIVADNIDLGGEAPDCFGTLTSQYYNHIESLDGCSFAGAAGDVTGSDPGLLPLGNHGGVTLTQGLATGSAAIDAIPNGENTCSAGVTTDQRGMLRPIDGDRDGAAKCDKGAYELAYGFYLPLVLRSP